LSREPAAESKDVLSLAGIEPVDLLGRNDRNLRLIESSLSGHVVVRGDQVILSGQRQEVQQLKRVFAGLIELVRQKKSLSEDDVRYAIETREHGETTANLAGEPVLTNSHREPVAPKTFGQRDYVRVMRSAEIVFAIGPAGTGKTYLAIAAAVAALRRREVDRIVLTRPAVEAGESLGFLPGDLHEKVDPYLRPLYDALQEFMGDEAMRRALDSRVVEVAPLAYMRGRTLRHAFVILDEAQNATLPQVKMFLTRLGPRSRAVVTGDITQIDLPQAELSGLVLVQDILKGLDGIEFVYLADQDVVRHRLVRRIIQAFAANSRPRGKEAGPETPPEAPPCD
jgi:phosphate starvation-inducible PhoH-like protein